MSWKARTAARSVDACLSSLLEPAATNDDCSAGMSSRSDAVEIRSSQNQKLFRKYLGLTADVQTCGIRAQPCQP
jgi:hypothetical protein